jgi:hypothetical protein
MITGGNLTLASSNDSIAWRKAAKYQKGGVVVAGGVVAVVSAA